MINLTYKNYLVIGGSGLIGRAIALDIAEAGGRVAVTFNHNRDEARETIKQLGGKALPGPYRLDAADLDSVGAFVDSMGRDRMRFDGLVYAAGVNVPGALDVVAPEVARRVIEVNCLGAWNVAQQVTPFVAPGGAVVFIGSSCAYTGGRVSIHYALSKSALSGLVRGLAWKLAERRIRVNVVHPGYVESPMAEGAGATANEAVARSVMGRTCGPDEVSGPVLWLLSDLSSYVTGQVVRVDGGILP